ncbi:AraC family transcriptional regulator ligand-binding domain-containing protein (plasmid) [Mesorhizobium sp. ORM8.1]
MSPIEYGTVSNLSTQSLLATLPHFRVNVNSVVAQSGLRNLKYSATSRVTPLATYSTMLEAAAADRNDATLGLSLGAYRPYSALGVAGRKYLSSASIGEGLRQFIRHYPLLQSRSRTELTTENGMAYLKYLITDPGVRYREQDANLTIACHHAILKNLLEANWHPSRVEFAHATQDAAAFGQHFQCPVLFNRPYNLIAFPARFLDCALPTSVRVDDISLPAEPEETWTADQGRLGLSDAIRAWLVAVFRCGESHDMDCAAADFGMSPRSFQRRLQEIGVSFLELRNEVRILLAASLLEATAMSITEVALSVGFSETSAFSRHFKSQMNLTPVQYRAQRRGDWEPVRTPRRRTAQCLIELNHPVRDRHRV